MQAIPADDRGFTLGDGLFETVLARAGELVLWDAHIDRLRLGCSIVGLPAPSETECRGAAEAAIRAGDVAHARAAVRLSWSAGSGGRGLDRPNPIHPRLSVLAAAAPASAEPVRLRTAGVRRNDRSPASRLKTLAYLDNVLARKEARDAGADEALMLNTCGELACAGAANLFWTRGRTVFTPALECGVLEGVMRGLLLARAPPAGWTVQVVRAGPDALDEAEAVFLTNSLIGVRAVSMVDDRAFEPHPSVEALAALVQDAV